MIMECKCGNRYTIFSSSYRKKVKTCSKCINRDEKEIERLRVKIMSEV